jgi:regulatory protein NPR1
METFTEPSSSISFTSSSLLSNGTSIPPHNLSDPTVATAAQAVGSIDHSQNIETLSLSRLSDNLERLLLESDDLDCTDAEIIVEGFPVGVHRCILAARSKFFYNLFSRRDSDHNALVKSDRHKPRYEMSKLVEFGKVGKDALMVYLGYIYTGKVKAIPQDASICADGMCPHDACWPAISFAVELVYTSYVFQVSELVFLFQVRLIYLFFHFLFLNYILSQVIQLYHVTNWLPILFVLLKPLEIEFSSDHSISMFLIK